MSVAGTISAAATLYFTGGNVQAAMAAYAIGSGVESMVNAPNTYGPRLEDLQVQMSSYGAPIPYEWGVNRHAGTIIWPQVIEPKENEHSESAKGGPDNVTYAYTLSFAVLIGATQIAGVQKIWANKKLVYDASPENTGPMKDPALGTFRVYLGTEDQEVDPLIEATDGPSPAYLGLAYIVFEDYDVTDTQGRPPQIEFKVITEGADDFAPEFTKLDDIPALTRSEYQSAYDSDLGRLWVHNGTDSSNADVTGAALDGSAINVYDIAARSKVATIGVGETKVGDLVYSPERLRVYGGGEYVQDEAGFAFASDPPALESTIPFTLHVSGLSWAPQPGTLAAINGGWLLAASSSSHVGMGVVLWNPEVGVFARTDGLGGGWQSQALVLADMRVAMISGDGLTLLQPDPAFVYTFHPYSDFGGQIEAIAEDRSRGRLLLSVGGAFWLLDLATGEATKVYEESGGMSIRSLIHDPRSDRYYVAYAGAAGISPHLLIIDPVSLESEHNISLGPVGAVRELFISPVAGEIVAVCAASVWLISGLSGALTPSKVPLSQIVGDICTMKEGLSPSQIDVTALTPLVDGYPLSRQMTRRAAIEGLQPIYPFDAVENDSKVQFVMRGGAVVAVIPEEDRAAREFGSALPDSLTITRAQDLELPFEVEIEYPDVDADHLVGAQYSRRLTKDTKQKVNVQTAVVTTAEKAKSASAVMLYEAWQQTVFKWTTTRKYSYLLPTDVVELPTKEASYRARITMKREQPSGIIEWEGKQEAADVYTKGGEGAAPTNYIKQSIFTPGTTVLELMDLPLLRDQDAGKGVPVAMAGTSASWPGAQLFKSTDAGSTYGALYSQPEAAVIGRATTALGGFTGGDIFDDGNSVTVKIQPGGQLISYSESQLLDGTSAFALGVNGRWEIVQYRTATLVAPLTYTLTGLLRGRKGTEWAAGTHQIADHFVMLNAGGIQFYDPGADDANIERTYKAPAFSASLSSATAVPFTDTRLRLRPYSVANLRVDPAADGYLITWAHRSIVGGGWQDGIDVPLDQAFVAFDVTLMTDDGSVVKTYSVTDESIAYTSAQATLDFGLLPASFQVRVAQRNADYGQGVGVTVSSDGSAFAYDVPAPQQTPETTPGANPSLIKVLSVKMTVQDGSPYSPDGAAPYYVRSSLVYYAHGNGLSAGDYVWRQGMPEQIFRQGYGFIGPFQDDSASPPPANSPDYANFLIFNKVREATADTFTLYDLDAFPFTSEASKYLAFSGAQTTFAAGTVQRVLVGQVPAIIDDPFLVPLPSDYVRPLSPLCPKLWDGSKFIAEAYGPADIPGNEDQRLMISTAGSSGWTTSPASGLGHGRMAYHGGLYVGWNGWFRVSADNLATWQARPMWDFPLHNTQGGIQFDRVLYLNGQFVALGERGYIVTSSDGLDWTEVSDGTYPISLREQAICGAAFDGTHYVIVGYNPGNYSKPCIYRGTSLGALEEVTVPHIGPEWAGAWGTLNEVKYESGRFIAIGSKLHIYSPLNDVGRVNQPFIITSTDGGATWTDVSFTGSLVVLGGDKMGSGLVDLVKVGSTWLATGQNCSATSTNGTAWTERTHPLEYRVYTVSNGSLAITNINNGGTSDENNMVWSTTDAINWTQVTV